MTTRLSWIGCFLALGTGAALAQAPESAPVGRESTPRGPIEPLEVTVDRIAASLDALVRLERLSVTMQRLEIEDRRLAPLRGEVEREQRQLRLDREDLAQLEGVIAPLDDQLALAVREGRTEEAADLREEKARLEAALEMRRGTVAAGESRVQELQIDYDRARRRLDELSARLDEAFAALLP